MQQIPDRSVNLVVTSPPYNLKNSTGNGMKDGRGGKWSNAALMRGYSHHLCPPCESLISAITSWTGTDLFRELPRELINVSKKPIRESLIPNSIMSRQDRRVGTHHHERIVSIAFRPH